MPTENDHLDNLAEIRSLMERSSRFISLSGLSGVFIGLFAIAGVTAAHIASISDWQGNLKQFVIMDAAAVLFASLFTAIILTVRKTRKSGSPIWDMAAKRLAINMLIPLLAGGIFCLALVCHMQYHFLAPATLVFYGLALVNASKYTLGDIRSLGIIEILLGLTASFVPAYGLLLWGTGFGLMHIIYGIFMFYKYEN